MKHVTVKFDEMIMFCNKPITKPEWVDTFKTHHFICQRKGETLWVFDPDLDREPVVHEKQSIANAAKVIDVVHFENFCTAFEEVVDVTNTNITDLLIVSDCKHRPNLNTIYKHVKKCNHELQMVVAYKEVQMSPMAGRGRRNVVEHVSIFSARPLVPVHEPRLFYTLTSCATNLMIQVDMLTHEEAPRCKKEVKEAIHTAYGLPRHERCLARDVLVPVLSKEKHICLWREQLHATKAKRAIIATPGGGVLLRACVAHGVKALVLSKNDAHMQYLREYVIEFMLTEAKMNSLCPYHIKRTTVISKLGLDVDDTQPSPLSKSITIADDIAADPAADNAGQTMPNAVDSGHAQDDEVLAEDNAGQMVPAETVEQGQAGNAGGQPSDHEDNQGSTSGSDSDKKTSAGSDSGSKSKESGDDPMSDLFDVTAAATKKRASAQANKQPTDGEAPAPKGRGRGRGRGKKVQNSEGAAPAKKRSRLAGKQATAPPVIH